jgi:TRAP-type C4-dicarboxylate transport system permease small subunit
VKNKLHFLSYTLEFLTCSFLLIAVLITAIQVMCRFLFDLSFSWSQEVLMISFVWFVLFGAALAVKHKEHLKIDLVENFPSSIRKLFKMIELIVIFAFLFVFIYYGILLIRDNFQSGQTVGFLPLQVAYVYMAIPISGLCMLYYTVKDLMRK